MKSSYVDAPSRSILTTLFMGGQWWIDTIRVRPQHRRQGIASKLLAEALEDADELGVNVKLRVHPDPWPESPNYHDLVSWYERNGFELDEDGMHMTWIPWRPPSLIPDTPRHSRRHSLLW